MTKADSKKGFGKFPTFLKLVVIWLGLAGLFDFIQFVRNFSDGIGFLLLGAINFLFIIGIIKKHDNSRLLTIFWIGMASFMRIILLAPIATDSEFTPGPYGLNLGFVYFDLSKYQMIALIVLNIVLNIGVLYVLLMPSTKAIFSSQSAKQETT